MSEPLMMTFVVDPPSDLDVRLINLLLRQASNNEQDKQAVILACKYIIQKYAKAKP